MTASERPVIGFLTDFGLDGAAATCRGVMLSICRDVQVIDISHTVPKYQVRDGAFILRAALPYLPVGVHVGVVDPGVGTPRRPIALRAERGDVLIGPDNGLLVPPAEALGGIAEARELTNRELWLASTSATFHGRDIFAPTAGHLAAGNAPYAAVGPGLPAADLVRLPQLETRATANRLETEITYVDSFGNLRLGGGRQELEAALGRLQLGTALAVTLPDGNDHTILVASFVASFGAVGRGEVLLYVDSSGNLAIAENQGDLASRYAARVGQPIHIGRQ